MGNGHKIPDELYRRIFERIYGLSPSQLGFEPPETIGLDFDRPWERCIDTSPTFGVRTWSVASSWGQLSSLHLRSPLQH